MSLLVRLVCSDEAALSPLLDLGQEHDVRHSLLGAEGSIQDLRAQHSQCFFFFF